MKLKWISAAILAGLVLVPSASAESPVLSSVDWEAQGHSRGRLVLQFAGTVPDLDVELTPGGIRVWLPGTIVDGDVAAAVSVSNDESGASLTLRRPGSAVKSVGIRGATVVVDVSDVAAVVRGGQEYRLGIGDVVAILVYRDRDLSGDYTVAQDGMIHMPLVEPVPAAGLTESDLGARLLAAMGDLFVDPQISVAIKSYQSQFVVVITEANGRAARVVLQPGMNLTDLLAEAGVALVSGQKVRLSRPGGEADRELTSADLDSAEAPLPRDGDTLTVLEPHYVFVTGEVRRPGKLIYTPGMTLQHALALVEGLTDWASRKDIRIQRQINDRTVDEVVNLKKVQERRVPDPGLLPGDLIVVRRRVL